MAPGRVPAQPPRRRLRMLKILTVFGTRPEAVKLAPVLRELEKDRSAFESVVCVTGQHREMLDQVLQLFDIKPDLDLQLMEQDQQLPDLTATAIRRVSEVVDRVKPDLLVVQGDTTSAMASALAAFYARVPIGHVEAGLRTGNRYSPFPEEINRHLITVLASYHFAPTETAREALLREGVEPSSVLVTGNTVVDALHWIVKSPHEGSSGPGRDGRRLILVTAHRREHFGKPFLELCLALRELVERNPEVELVYPVHLNPNVQKPVRKVLANVPRVHLLPPLKYGDFIHLLSQAYLVLTDSGGIQEEAPVLGKPVLVMRRETERPEAVAAGVARLVGPDRHAILEEAEELLNNPSAYDAMAKAQSPFGDGHAAERIAAFLKRLPAQQRVGDAE